MGIFSKKNKDNVFFEMLESKPENNQISVSEDNNPAPSYVLTAEEVLGEKTENGDGKPIASPLEALKKRMSASSEGDNKSETAKEEKFAVSNEEKPQDHRSLLEKVKVYTTDEEGQDHSVSNEPIYKLESVADILKSDSESFIDSLSKKYNLSVEDLTAKEEPKTEIREISTKTDTFDDLLKYNPPKEEQISVSEIQTNLPDISDIDNFVSQKEQESESESDNSATIKFVPIKEDDITHIAVTSTTKPIDITKELEEIQEDISPEKTVLLEKNDFEEFSPNNEIDNEQDIKKYIRKYSLKKRSAFVSAFVSGFSLILLLLFLIPPLSDILIRDVSTGMIICGILLLISTFANINMFKSVTNFFKKSAGADALAMFASISAVALSVSSYIAKQSSYEIILIADIMLFLRAIGSFCGTSSILGNLKQLAKSSKKNAVTLINDASVTFAMAKNSIEGDVLISASRKADFVTDFMKYSKYGLFLNGKSGIITIAALVLSVVVGFITANISGDTYSAIYAATSILLIASLPSYFLIDSLPNFSASKKLNKTGSMLAGKTAAEQLELANAVVLSSYDIFPSGTVTMHDMKILAENTVDDTLIRAASLTKAINSPLYPIFEEIADTNSSYSLPDSDSIKYEEKLGISGWVDNKLLFIGNRTLMEAHGIDVLDLELDRQILRRGFFPIYVASENKACALLIVQYNVDHDVAKQLKKITKLGVTVLVNNNDPNISEEMICDYIGLYSDSVKVMSNAGVHMYNTAVTPVESCSAPAIFRGDGINFITLMNCASSVKKSNAALSFLYVFFMCLVIVLYVYALFTQGNGLPSGLTLLLTEVAATIFTYIVYLFKKP